MDQLMPGLSHAPNAHPFFVHVPLVLWLAALGFWIVGAVGRRPGVWKAGSVLLYVAVLASVPDVVTGLGAEEQFHAHGDEPEPPWMEKVHVHRNFMLVTASAAAVLVVLTYAVRRRESQRVRWALVASLVLVNAVAFLGADRGAELVLRHGVGTVPGTSPPAHSHGP